MILSFKQTLPDGKPTNFEQKIQDGIKIHSIREDRNDRWNAGMPIQCAHGVRTKNYRCFAVTKCTGTQRIKIREMIMVDWFFCATYKYFDKRKNEDMMKIFIVEVDGRLLNRDEITTLARNDGFGSVNDFFAWFNGDFEGKIIHWSDFRY